MCVCVVGHSPTSVNVVDLRCLIHFSPCGRWSSTKASPPAHTPSLISLVPVRVRLVRAGDGDGDVIRLGGGQLRQLSAELAQVQAGNLLVKLLGEEVHTPTRVLAAVGGEEIRRR